MSVKKKRKAKRDLDIYSDISEMEIRRKRPNLYKLPVEREKLYWHLHKLSGKSNKYIKELRIKGISNRCAEEIALTSWM